jgi:hypothetical protein
MAVSETITNKIFSAFTIIVVFSGVSFLARASQLMEDTDKREILNPMLFRALDPPQKSNHNKSKNQNSAS